VRSAPTAAENRWALVEILCQLCQWDRALQQLQAWARLVPQGKAQAHLLRGLIQAENQRMRVFRGQERAAPVVDFPDWMQDMAKALEHNAAGEPELADTCRRQALEHAPSRPGVCSWRVRRPGQPEEEQRQQDFDWLADSDTRLGPICEVILAGAYRWVAFSDLALLQLTPPKTPLDLVWTPAQLQLHGAPKDTSARTLHVYLPSRSCWTHAPNEPTEQQQALMQSHLTVWQEVGDTGVFSQGQKTWMSDGTDWPLLDIREVRT
jgi:type VI secretion system protein ImpE